MNFFIAVVSLFVVLMLPSHVALAANKLSAQQYVSLLLKKSEQGYLSVPHGKLWYWFVKADKPDAPLTIWLNGGPGCSSMFGLFAGNGPYLLQNLAASTQSPGYQFKSNPYAWTKLSNMIYLDNPVGTGFSLLSRYDTTPTEIRQDVVHALKEFYNLHPELKKIPLFIFGESYAGKYIPDIAYEIKRHTDFNLKGIGIGNGFIDPESNNVAQTIFAKNNALITEQQELDLLSRVQSIWKHFYVTRRVGHQPNLHLDEAAAYYALDQINKILKQKYGANELNNYDIRRITRPYDDSNLQLFLNDKQYRPINAQGEWKECGQHDGAVKKSLMTSIPASSAPMIVRLLRDDRLPVLIFNGMDDLMVPYLSHKLWLNKYGISLEPEDTDGLVYHATAYPLSLVFIKNSGHMVVMDQPKLAYELFAAFIQQHR